MGMPACRISDTTEHGGVIILGFPTVMIGMLPASRITDMHTCPMVTGIVPHVGGPFILGSPTVQVGFMPQSRVTDQLVCVGPPDMAILGDFTVLVGMAGAGGAVSASDGAAAMGAPVAPASPAAQAAAAKQPKAEAQADGTVKTSAPPGEALPPMALNQPGWPTLPPEATTTFESVQPATVQPGTTLYAATEPGGTTGSFFGVTPPAVDAPIAGSALNAATHVAVAQVPAGPAVKAWAGKPAHPPKPGDLQVWMPPGSMDHASTERFRMPGSAASGVAR